MDIDEIKKCVVCGKVIANIYDCDYYRYIRLKYCDECKQMIYEQNNIEYQRRHRKKRKAIKDRIIELKDDRIALLEQENAELEKKLRKLLDK